MSHAAPITIFREEYVRLVLLPPRLDAAFHRWGSIGVSVLVDYPGGLITVDVAESQHEAARHVIESLARGEMTLSKPVRGDAITVIQAIDDLLPQLHKALSAAGLATYDTITTRGYRVLFGARQLHSRQYGTAGAPEPVTRDEDFR
ncbi:MAG: hypothetical protein JWM49_640 [Microbacteriaceae bacterium]|nr:hypothetical protein [Microbacteriaceae bacterium]